MCYVYTEVSIARSATNPPKVALFHICKIINLINLTPDESQEDEAAADFSWSLHLAPVKDTFHKPVLCCNSWHIATHLALCNKVLNQGGSYHHNTAPSLNSDLLSNFTIFPINYHHGRTEAKKSLWLRVIKFSNLSSIDLCQRKKKQSLIWIVLFPSQNRSRFGYRNVQIIYTNSSLIARESPRQTYGCLATGSGVCEWLHLFIPVTAADPVCRLPPSPRELVCLRTERLKCGEQHSAPACSEDQCVNGPHRAHSTLTLFKYRHQLLDASTPAQRSGTKNQWIYSRLEGEVWWKNKSCDTTVNLFVVSHNVWTSQLERGLQVEQCL